MQTYKEFWSGNPLATKLFSGFAVLLMTHDLVEGDIRMKRAIFRKAVKVFKKNVMHQDFKINEMTFQDCLRLALYEEFPTPG